MHATSASVHVPEGHGEAESVRPDREHRALRIAGNIVRVAPRSFDLFDYLWQHRDRVVTKSELLASLWPSGSRSHSLRQEVYSLRRTLATYGLGEMIATVSHYGYRVHLPAGYDWNAQRSGALPEYYRRALAAVAHFEHKADTNSWSRALYWYERLSNATPMLADLHVGAIRAAIGLLVRAQIPVGEAQQIVTRHVRLLEEDSRGSLSLRLFMMAAAGLFSEGDVLSALDSTSRAGALDSQGEALRALLKLSVGDCASALAAQESVLRLSPESIEAHLMYGRLLLYNKRDSEALGQFRFLRQLEPDNADFLESQAWALLSCGEPDEALAVLNERKQRTARDAVLRCAVHARNGNHDSAMEALQWLLAAGRTTYVSPLHLAACYVTLQQPAEARTMLRRARREPAARWFCYDPIVRESAILS